MAGRWAVYAAVLLASWQFNLLGLPDGAFWSRAEPRWPADGPESRHVYPRAARPDLPALYPLFDDTADGSAAPYRSQFGLPGVVLAGVATVTGADPTGVVAAGGLLGAVLLAALVAAVFVGAQRWVGPPAGDVACVLAACCPALLPAAGSPYWVPALMLAPFALVWCLYPRARTPGRRAGLLAGVGVLVGVKALAGYEYITAVVLAPVAAGWLHQVRLGEPVGRRGRFVAGVIGAGGVGFAAAVGLHVAQIGLVVGDDGLKVIRNRATARTVAAADTAPPAECFVAYFGQPAVSTPGAFGKYRRDVPLGWVTAGAAGLAAAGWLARRRVPAGVGGATAAVLPAFLAAVSWQVLAVNHMCVHLHLNRLVFAVPFLPVAFVAAGAGVRWAVGPGGGRWAGPLLLVAVAGVMVWTVAADDRRRAAEAADQARAEEAVAARLAAGDIPTDAGVGGAVDAVRLSGAMPATLRLPVGQFDRRTGRPTDPGAVVIDGWALAGWRTADRPTARVVAAVGGRVVGCEVYRFRRPDLDRLGGRPLPAAGFVAVVPSAAVVDGGPVRLFAVSTADPRRVTELSLPR